jgi:hypothetical protein
MHAILPALWTNIFDYARRLGRLRDRSRGAGVGSASVAAVTPAPPASAPTGQLSRDGVPLGLDRKHHRANRGFVGPLLRV